MKFSRFAEKFQSSSGILRLMDDLGSCLSDDQDSVMLGGGNPAHIPEVQHYFRQRMQHMLDHEREFQRVIGDYDSPQGNEAFITALVELLQDHCGWPVQPENIALTTGSQSSFFFLFNLLAGSFEQGEKKKILFPMVPEYIGYADLGLDSDLFIAARPHIEHLDHHLFKYRLNFDQLNIDKTVGAICLSRPTNPTANVVTDDELLSLMDQAERKQVPLIIDSAYGLPFPNILFTQATSFWNQNLIVCMSLSKLGLPGVRTGIVVADKTVIEMITRMNATLNLSPGSMGPALALDLVRTGEILNLSNDIIRPYYQSKAEQAIDWLHQALAGLDYHIHKPEGAIFLWLWIRGLPVSNQVLYERLKQQGVVIVPGHHFFFGLEEDWPHRYECIRMTYAQPTESVKRGIVILGQEIRTICSEGIASSR